MTVPQTRCAWALACALGAMFAHDGAAQTLTPWSATVSTERAHVSVGVTDQTWTKEAAQISWSEPADGGWVGVLERVTRNGLVDVSISTRGYSRVRDWTFLAGGGVTPAAQFLYRGFVEGEVSRRVVGTLVATGGYRFLLFRQARIHQFQPALTWYHPRGEVGARMFATHNATQDRTTPALLVSTTYKLSPRFELSGGASFGDRIFDIAALPTGAARSRVGFAGIRVAVTPRDSIHAGATVAQEDPSFAYRSFTLSYGRSF